jgi:hypothetical protein
VHSIIVCAPAHSSSRAYASSVERVRRAARQAADARDALLIVATAGSAISLPSSFSPPRRQICSARRLRATTLFTFLLKPSITPPVRGANTSGIDFAVFNHLIRACRERGGHHYRAKRRVSAIEMNRLVDRASDRIRACRRSPPFTRDCSRCCGV